MYKVTISETNNDKMSARERIKIKDTHSMLKLDELVKEDEEVIFTPMYYAIIHIQTDDEEYEKYVVVDNDGKYYSTSSNIWFDSFINIDEEMRVEGEYELCTYKGVSRNGNTFLTCTVE